MSQSTPDARSIVTAARGNCNILKNNFMISTVIGTKRKLTIWTDYLFPDGFMRPKKIQLFFARGLPSISILLIIKLN